MPGAECRYPRDCSQGYFHYGDTFLGFSEGWRGVFENKTEPLDLTRVAGILPRGGTILRTSRTNPAKREGGIQRCMENLQRNGLDALIALGGDDTMSVALRLFEAGFKVIGVPKTIDNERAPISASASILQLKSQRRPSIVCIARPKHTIA